MYLGIVAQFHGCLGPLGKLSAAAMALLIVGLCPQRAPPRGAPPVGLLGWLRLRLDGAAESGVHGDEDNRSRDDRAVLHAC